MDIDVAIALVDEAVYHQTRKHLNDLQQAVLLGALQGKKYLEIAEEYNCTEGHAKDTGAWLWQLLSQVWGQKITKSNFRSSLQAKLKVLAKEKAPPKNFIKRFNSRFLGREKEILNLENLFKEEHSTIVLQGEGGVGKTTLAQQFIAKGNFEVVLELLMAKETANIIPAATVVEEWLERDFKQDSGKEFGVNLARLKRCLSVKKVGVLIDNLEPALDKDGKFLKDHRNYLELFRVLANSSLLTTTIITSRDRLCEPDLHLIHYRLTGLDLATWKEYFTAKNIKFKTPELTPIHQQYAGNAKAMGILGGIIREDYDGNLGEYWQENYQDPLVETDLKNLISSQLNRLEKLDRRGYFLLCRLSCYRYQDLATVSPKGVFCLLWDVSPAKHPRTIKSLRNRSLVEYERGKYWLHPIVKAEGQLRLQKFPPQWEESHRRIASFLTDSVTKINNIEAGLTALEAYYHYMAIADYDGAAKVILQSRENQWGQFLTLGTNLYRLGIIHPLLTAIAEIIDKIKEDRHRSELNNILGDLYWTTGKIHQAIACQQKTIATSQKCLTEISPTPVNRYDLYYWKMLEVDSLLSLGLYNIDLWELTTAADFFKQAIALAHNTKHHPWAEKAALGLALINSYLTPNSTPDNIVNRLYRLIVDLEDNNYNTGRFAYFMQILGQIFFNIKQIEPASIMWQRAIAFSEESHYRQIKAKSLMGLASIQRYLKNWHTANYYHQQATELLDNIGAKCDLAEAYYQWGITLQISGNAESQNYFNQAVAIFQEIQAPKQIEKIKQDKGFS